MNRKIVIGGSVAAISLLFAGWSIASVYHAEQVRVDQKPVENPAQSDQTVFEYDSLNNLEFTTPNDSMNHEGTAVEEDEGSVSNWPPRKPVRGIIPPRKPVQKSDVINSRPNCKKVQTDNLTALACNVYHEARGESEQGQAMVALVTLNRVRSGLFGHTIQDVVYQPGQFSWTTMRKVHGTPTDGEAWETAVNIAWKASHGEVWVKGVTPDHLWYHEKSVHPNWGRDDNKKRTGRVDNHVIYAKAELDD